MLIQLYSNGYLWLRWTTACTDKGQKNKVVMQLSVALKSISKLMASVMDVQFSGIFFFFREFSFTLFSVGTQTRYVCIFTFGKNSLF